MVNTELEKINISSMKGKLRGFFLGNNRFALYFRKELSHYFGYAEVKDGEKPVFDFETVTTKTGKKAIIITLSGYENSSSSKEEDEKE